MKHLANDFSDSAIYRYVVGFFIGAFDLMKKCLMFTLIHSTDILMVVAFIGAIIAACAFESNAINFTVCILFITILLAWVAALLKIKILEDRGDNDRTGKNV